MKAGFVVVAPFFPDTNTAAVRAKGGDNEADVINQPADVDFVTNSAIADDTVRSASCPRLFGLVDTSEIGLAGQSDGGDTVAMAAYDSRYYSHPGITFRGVAVLSGAEWYWTGADPYAGHPASPPMLVVQSATDTCNPPQDSAKLYDDDASSQKWFLRIISAPHLAPYDGDDAAAFAVVARTTTRFFEIEVTRSEPSARLRSVGNSSPAVARLTTGPSAPALPSLTQTAAGCRFS